MQIPPPTSPALQAFTPVAATTPSSQGGTAETGGAPASAARQKTAPATDARDAIEAEGERVTLSASAEPSQQLPDLAPVYAEVWKDGVKVAVIDTHGGVVGLNGFVAPAAAAAGAGGAELAARRAAMIAHTIGGEIRVGGQVMDSQTLAMRAKLKAAYGA